jgi:peptidylprolyl isomerase
MAKATRQDVAQLDAELAQLLVTLPGRYAGDAPDPAHPGLRIALHHKIIRVVAPQFGGDAVFYHQISHGDPDSLTPFQRKIYVFDRNPARSFNSMRAFVFANGQGAANLERDPAGLLTLDPAQLMNFPLPCAIRWSRNTARNLFVARVHRENCSYDSAAFKQRISPELTYELANDGFAIEDVLYGADGRPLFPPSGLLHAKRTTAVPPSPGTMAAVLAASSPSEWRRLDPARTLYMELPTGRVVIELAVDFAPLHAENIKTLVRQRFFDGLAIDRVQDNFVTQWGDADGSRPLLRAAASLPPEFSRDWTPGAPFTALTDADGFAPTAGFSDGFAVAGDPATKRLWMAHCYGALGVGRDNEETSGNGAELYAVIGHAPRQLDRNIAVVGRVVMGMNLLAALQRGTGPLGFYERESQRTPILSMRLATDLPELERTRLELLRTDSPSFKALIEARRNRRDEWYKVPAGYIDLCNVPLPARGY